MYDVIIIGSGPAGLSAAVYAQRASLSAIVIEKDYEGAGQIADSGRVDNYLGLPGISGYDLGETFRNHALQLGVEFLEREVTSIARDETGIFYVGLADDGWGGFGGDAIADASDASDPTAAGDANTLAARAVIYAAGAYPRRAGIPGEQEFSGNGVSYCAICDGSFYRGRKVAVLGGGDTALDDAMYLSGLAERVYLVHRREQFRGAQATVERLREKENVEFVLNAQAVAITGETKVTGLDLIRRNPAGNADTGRTGGTGAAHEQGAGADANESLHLDVDGVFVAYGSVPRTSLLQGLVDLDPAGYVIAGETGATSLPGLYVAGDARTKHLRQVVTAVADGASAATAVAAYLQ